MASGYCSRKATQNSTCGGAHTSTVRSGSGCVEMGLPSGQARCHSCSRVCICASEVSTNSLLAAVSDMSSSKLCCSFFPAAAISGRILRTSRMASFFGTPMPVSRLTSMASMSFGSSCCTDANATARKCRVETGLANPASTAAIMRVSHSLNLSAVRSAVACAASWPWPIWRNQSNKGNSSSR